MLYKNSIMDTYLGDGLNESISCQVRFDGSIIVISYDDEDGPTVYLGSEVASGHYKLESADPKGRATLHRFPDDDILEGWWAEAGFQGMWRIQLEE